MDTKEFMKVLCRNRQLSLDQFLSLEPQQTREIVFNLDEEANTIIHQFAKDGDNLFLSTVLERLGPRDHHIVFFRNSNGMSPIDVAALYDNFEVLNNLIEYSVRIRMPRAIFLETEVFTYPNSESKNFRCENKLCSDCQHRFLQPIIYALRHNFSRTVECLAYHTFSEMIFDEKNYHVDCSDAEKGEHRNNYTSFSKKVRCIIDRMYKTCLNTNNLESITFLIQQIISKMNELNNSFRTIFRDCKRCRNRVLGCNSTLQSKVLLRVIDETYCLYPKRDVIAYVPIFRTFLSCTKNAGIERINRVKIGHILFQTYDKSFWRIHNSELLELILAWNVNEKFSNKAGIKLAIQKFIYNGLRKAIMTIDYRSFELIVFIAIHFGIELNGDGTILDNTEFGPLFCTIIHHLAGNYYINTLKDVEKYFNVYRRMVEMLLLNKVNPYLIHGITALGNNISGLNYEDNSDRARIICGFKKKNV